MAYERTVLARALIVAPRTVDIFIYSARAVNSSRACEAATYTNGPRRAATEHFIRFTSGAAAAIGNGVNDHESITLFVAFYSRLFSRHAPRFLLPIEGPKRRFLDFLFSLFGL